MRQSIIGTVVGFAAPYHVVHCPEAPRQFEWIHLSSFEIRGAKVGDRVRLVRCSSTNAARSR